MHVPISFLLVSSKNNIFFLLILFHTVNVLFICSRCPTKRLEETAIAAIKFDSQGGTYLIPLNMVIHLQGGIHWIFYFSFLVIESHPWSFLDFDGDFLFELPIPITYFLWWSSLKYHNEQRKNSTTSHIVIKIITFTNGIIYVLFFPNLASRREQDVFPSNARRSD